MATDSGISFPFRFGAGGGTAGSQLTNDDYSRLEESLHQIIFTNPDERVYENNFGTDLRQFLFENLDDITNLTLLRHEIRKSIEKQEPRIQVTDVRVYTLPNEEGKLFIDVDCIIIQFNKDATLSISYDLPDSNL